MTHLVPKLETCLKLGEAGYPDNTEFVWVLANPWDENPSIVFRPLAQFAHKTLAPAPTLGELVRELDAKLQLFRFETKPKWCAMRKVDTSYYTDAQGDTPEEAFAQLWLRKEGK